MAYQRNTKEERLSDYGAPPDNHVPPVARDCFTLTVTCDQRDKAFMEAVFDTLMGNIGCRYATAGHISYVFRMDDAFYKRVTRSVEFQESMKFLCTRWFEETENHRGIDIEMHMPRDAAAFGKEAEKTHSPHLMYLTLRQELEETPIATQRFDWLAKGFEEGKEFLHQVRTCNAAQHTAKEEDFCLS